jgi:hypothetical protein
MFQTKVVEKIEKHRCSITLFFFSKILLLWDNVEGYSRTLEVTDNNAAHARGMFYT